MLMFSEITEIVGQCDYPGLKAELQIESNLGAGVFNLSVVNEAGMRSRKWRLSGHMTRSEVVQTVFLAIKTWQEHELREAFLYGDDTCNGPPWGYEVVEVPPCAAASTGGK